LGCEKLTAKWLRFLVSLPVSSIRAALSSSPGASHLTHTSWTLDRDQSRLDVHLDYLRRSR
jgi:hypothetical protein